MTKEPRWGVCATAKASTGDILRFAAHYLDAGAHRVLLYLDDANNEAYEALKAQPKCRAHLCDDRYWHRHFGRRPSSHQRRQTRNATRSYQKAKDLDWLLHADIDEFLIAKQPVAATLTRTPHSIASLRVRPMEVLSQACPSDGPRAFKTFIPAGPARAATVREIYPTYGKGLRSGFLSHAAGKVFARTGVADLQFRIHRVFDGATANPDQSEAENLALAHLHAPNWDIWRSRLEFRLNKGAYRRGLSTRGTRAPDAMALHHVLSEIKTRDGDSGLRAFFDEVCMDSPQLRARLGQKGLLALHDLRLNAKLHQYFGDKGPPSASI